MDARPSINAKANSMTGGGTENTDYYENVSLVFCNIENIHRVRDSLNALEQAVYKSNTKAHSLFSNGYRADQVCG